jgi:hypothetical protein
VKVQTGEIYGKQTSSKLVMYNVLKVSKPKDGNKTNIGQEIVTLQNIDNLLSLFETTAQKLASSGYILISQTPFIDLNATTPKKRKAAKKPTRCPLTLDFLEARADSERPAPVLSDLFS